MTGMLFDNSPPISGPMMRFDDMPLSKNDHPESSHESEADLKQSGRLNRHCQAILELFEGGAEVTNIQMAEISKNHTARISNLRAAGYAIDITRRDRKSGVCWYRLKKQGR